MLRRGKTRRNARYGKSNTVWKRFDRWCGRRRAGEKEAADQRRCLGRSRGGLTTKLPATVGRRGRLLKLLVTAGQCGDASQAESLLEELKLGTVGHVLADAAYDNDAIRQRVPACIRPNPKRKKGDHRGRYKN